MTLPWKRPHLIAMGSGSAHASVHPVGTGNHGNPKLHLAVNVVHLLATAGAVIETARELCEWLHLLQL
jgi:hypothetical protein